jgi:hypothetical protein
LRAELLVKAAAGETQMRIVLGVVAGVVVAMLSVFAVEYAGQAVYPPPAGTDLNDLEQVARMMASAPTAALAFVAAAWFVGALAGAWTANAVARRALAGWVVALLVLAASIAIMLMIPGHPTWMWAAGILLPLIGGWLAQRLAKVSA